MIGVVTAATLAMAQAASPSPSPRVSPSPRPIADSVERVIDRMEAERKDPCLGAREEGVPCFPVETSREGPRASVREGLGLPDPAPGKEAPGRPPTRDELGPYREATSPPPLVSVTFDPGCVGKSIWKGLRGKNDTYYLYRVRDVHGARVVLYDHRIDAARFQGEVELLGEFKGECEAIAAYERERRKATAP